MPNETTQGAGRGGGRPTREPVPVPPIARGAFSIRGSYEPRQFQDGARWTFSLPAGAAVLTYHDAEVISVRHDELTVFVGPHDVVTWDYA